MRSFSFPRLWQVIKWNTIVNRKQTLRGGIAVAIVVFLLAFLQLDVLGLIQHGYPVDIFRYEGMTTMFTLILVVQSLGFAGRICFNMRQKNDIVNYLMLPATKLEKYIANIFHMLVERLAVTLAGMLVADLIIVILELIFSHTCHSMLFYWLTTNTTGITSIFAPASAIGILGEVGDGLMSAAFLLSLFLLGGTFFRKNPVLLTVLTIIFIPMLFMLCVSVPIAWIVNSLVSEGYEIVITPLVGKTFVHVVFYAVIILWTCFNLWLSYRKFARLQVINNKYFN